MSVNKICIISPGHLSTNPRLVKEADALAEAGHEVSVIIADFLPWARDKDLSFGGKPWRITAKLPFGPYAPFVTRVKQVLRHNPARWLAKQGIGPKFMLEAAAHPITEGLTAAACKTPADLYIAHYVAALPAAAAAARRHATLYAYDAEDFHMGDWPEDPAFEFERHLVREIEGRYIPGCAYVTAASPMIAEALVETYAIETPQVVLNVFPRSQAPAKPKTRGSIATEPSIYWFSQTIGPNRGLECAVRAIGLSVHCPHLYLRGTPVAGYLSKLEKLAGESGAEGRVHFLPPSEPEQMEILAAEYDLGLCGEPGHTRNNRRALANKLFSFLLAGLPPLMSATPAQHRFVTEAGFPELVYPIDNAQALAKLIDRLLGAPDQLATLRERMWCLGQERYNWEREGELVKNLVARTLKR